MSPRKAATARRPASATACPPSGSRNARPGWRGRIIAATGRENLQPIPYVYAEIVRHLARAARVELIVNDAKRRSPGAHYIDDMRMYCPRWRRALPSISWPTNRGWLRDSGPIFVNRQAGQGRAHQLEVQRLGQVQELAAR